MRIEGYIEHPVMKITIFKMDEKFSVKFETELYSQTYKIRTGNGLDSLEDIRRLVNTDFQEEVLKKLGGMHGLMVDANKRFTSGLENEFEEII